MKSLVEFITESQNKKEFMIIKPEFLHLKNQILDYLKDFGIIPIREMRKTLTFSEAKKLYKPLITKPRILAIHLIKKKS